ncbi:MAG: hypothetical protein ABIG32_00125 [Candidatus Uhrbacteria bacterium]|nr:hypothetical protein [Patescibacteria group bacterium]MBU1906910.1 hypothetical protein [Patescibacteria group bacterium]
MLKIKSLLTGLLQLIGLVPRDVLIRVPVQSWIASGWSFPVYDNEGTCYGADQAEAAQFVRMRGLPLYNYRTTNHPDDLLVVLIDPTILVEGSIDQVRSHLRLVARGFSRRQFERRLIRRGYGEYATYHTAGYGRDAFGYLWVEGPLEFKDVDELRSGHLDHLNLAETFRQHPLLNVSNPNSLSARSVA